MCSLVWKPQHNRQRRSCGSAVAAAVAVDIINRDPLVARESRPAIARRHMREKKRIGTVSKVVTTSSGRATPSSRLILKNEHVVFHTQCCPLGSQGG